MPEEVRLTLSHDGQNHVDFTVAELLAANVPQEAIDEAVAVQKAMAVRDRQRADIRAAAGDTLSLLGTASDGANLVLYHLAKLVTGISSATSLAEVREAAASFAPQAEAFLAKVAADEVKLPFQTKGEDVVIAEIETRATAVSDALQTDREGG